MDDHALMTPTGTSEHVDSAKAAGLRYVTDAMPGITRKRRGKGALEDLDILMVDLHDKIRAAAAEYLEADGSTTPDAQLEAAVFGRFIDPAARKVFYDTYKDKGFELIAVSIDDDEKELRTVSNQRGYTFPVAWRYDDKTDDNFGDVIGTPTLYVVDKTGKVAWTKRGRVTYAQLQEIVEPLLK